MHVRSRIDLPALAALDSSRPKTDADSVADLDEPETDPVADLPWRGTSEQLDEDLADREIQAKLRDRILGHAHRPLYVGRFRLLRKLGEGAMGTVYAAHDDELDREVAIKLLHPAQRHDEHAMQRLRREATALARLSHPNLVPVFEVGDFEDQVFLAMELVPGVTMDEWTRQRPRPWRAVLGHWLNVARALATVHEARLVHRDIKPHNVLVGLDGRARLVDFGLARGHASEDSSPGSSVESRPVIAAGPDAEESDSGSARLQQIITQPHTVVGTPAYMAPEVRAGELGGPRADQYSLCVSIYESLYGRRPRRLVGDGSALVEVPNSTATPVAVRRALTRGLARKPSDRFTDVRALIRALERAMSRRSLRLAAGGAALVVAAITGSVVTQGLSPSDPAPVDPCAAVDDDLGGMWDPSRREAVRAGIMATEVPYAPKLSEQLDGQLQAYSTTWLHARRQACEATRVELVQSEGLLDRRMDCLDGQRHTLAALLAVATEASAEQVPRLPMMLAELPDPSECLGDALVHTSLPPPPAAIRDEVEQLRATIARLRQEAVLAGSMAVREPAQGALDQAESLGYRPLMAEASLLLGAVHRQADDPQARAHLERAVNLAEEVDHVDVKEEALRQLVLLAIDVELDAEEAGRRLDRELAVIERMGAPPRRKAAVTVLRAGVAVLADDFVAAEAGLREAALQWEALGERQAPALATSLRELGNLRVGRGRHDEAKMLFDRAAQLDARWGGNDLEVTPGQTSRGHGELSRGVAATNAGHFDAAESWLERAHRESSQSYGEQSVPVGRVEVAMANLAARRGRLDDVLRHAQSADACFRRWLGEDHQLRASALAAMGTVAFHLGQGDRAVEAFSEELRLTLSALPAHGVRAATARSNLGEALVLAGRHDEAKPQLEQALADLERVLLPSDALLSFPAHALAEIAWHRRDLEVAHHQAQRALTIREQHSDNPVELARTRWLLARVQHARGQPERARELAEEARDGFGDLGPPFAGQAQQVDVWLRSPR